MILRTLLDPQSLTGTLGRTPELVATDPLLQPQGEPQATLPKLIKSAWERRPDVQQARLQVINGERQVASAANAAKPEIDLYGSYESRGVVIPGLITIGRRWLTGNATTDPIPTEAVVPRRCLRLEYSSSYQYKTEWRERISELTRRF